MDLEPTPDGAAPERLQELLHSVNRELEPSYILLDARTGISEVAGTLLSGIAHLHVLVGSTSEQSWDGLGLVLDRLGGERVQESLAQADCVVVQAMIPPDSTAARLAREDFKTRSRDEFADRYYSEADPAVEERLWTVEDLESDDAPHVPVPVAYNPRLAHFKDIADVADLLADDPEYRALADRVSDRFVEVED